QILLPNLETYRKFIYGIPFYNGQISAEEIKHIQVAMIEAYDKHCKQHFQGQYVFDFHIYVVTAKK
ncbi:MAG TPA: class I SAM-dependent methyltransferase, partial [Legionellaceae bacterium]|nr:class I SAM-dependent methyltransferase [Legionellaceae bacterium]